MRNSSSLDWLRFMHTPNDYRVSPILEAAIYAPSGMHLETWHFTAIQNVDKLTELNERIKGAFAKSDDSRCKSVGIARPIVVIIMLRLW